MCKPTPHLPVLPVLSGKPMKSAFYKDIGRFIGKNKKRFAAIAIITALGVTVLSGIYAACQDMYRSADAFYDAQGLYDIQIVSTLGLTDADVEALSRVPGVQTAVGTYSETVDTAVNGSIKTAEITVLNHQGVNSPYLVQGQLPQNAGEIAVTQAYLDETGKALGDTVSILQENPIAVEQAAEEDTAQEADASSQADAGDSTDIPAINWDEDISLAQETESATFTTNSFTITAVVINPMDISSSTASFRSTATHDYVFYVLAADADFSVYTSVYLTLTGLAEINTYAQEYEDTVQQFVTLLENTIVTQREQARYQQVLNEALEKITDAERTMNETFADAEQQFADAWEELTTAKQELVDGEATLSAEEKDALQQLAQAAAELEEGRTRLQAGEAELAQGEAQLYESAQLLQENKEYLAQQRQAAEEGFAQAEAAFAAQQAVLSNTLQQLAEALPALQQVWGAAWPEAEWQALVAEVSAQTLQGFAQNPEAQPDSQAVAQATIAQQDALAAALLAVPSTDAAVAQQQAAALPQVLQAALGYGIAEGSQQFLQLQQQAYQQQKNEALAQLEEGETQLANGEQQLAEGWAQIEAGRAQIAGGWAELAEGEATLAQEREKALSAIATAWQDLAEGREKLADGEAELTETEQTYEEKRQEALQKINDAYAELADIEMAQWYVQTRSMLDSYASLKSDMGSIEALGNAFPVVFLIVAILISLTTMSRMVEEERSLMGTYKALGFSNGAIYLKYLVYAFLACLAGGIIGDILGFIVLPKLLLYILQALYTIPNISLGFYPLYGVGGVLMFMVSIVAATAFTCRKELVQTPATLMRPKAPRAGSRIFLERFTFIWARLRFLNKVTARNLFRYKKRLFMTVIGIMGCTALMLAGFAIRDSVESLLLKQYNETYLYNLMLVADEKDNAELLQLAETSPEFESYLNVRIESFKLLYGESSSSSMQLIVVPDGQAISEYINLRDTKGNAVSLTGEGIYVTQNAAEILGVTTGSEVTLQSLTLNRAQANVAGVVQNYLGNNIYITQQLYAELYGEATGNALLAKLALPAESQPAYAESLLDNSFILSSVSIEALKLDFASNFTLVNAVVYLFIVLAAGLAFVVLFTLANTNISERARELATIKVLGFFDNEVHAYVNKETIILTIIGVAVGLPVGRFISGLLTMVLKIDALYFAVSINPLSYVFAAALSIGFALIVNLITNRLLDKIDMVEALKSVE